MVLLLSDIHGNLEALESVLRQGVMEQVSKVMIAGDIIDYGADSIKVIKSLEYLKSIVPVYSIYGNHEKSVLNHEGSLVKTPHGNLSVNITRSEISEYESLVRDFYTTSDTSLIVGLDHILVRMVHGSLQDTDRGYEGPVDSDMFDYFVDIDDNSSRCTVSFDTSIPLVVGGHSHIQGLRSEFDYLYINPGSVGQPRNGDPRAQFAILDEYKGRVDFYRVSYDNSLTSKKILASGRSQFLSSRLLLGI